LTENGWESFRENEFFRRVQPFLRDLLNAVKIIDTPRFGDGNRPDMLAILSDGSHAIIEIKASTPITQTRLDQVVEQLARYESAYQEAYQGKQAKLVLVVPGALSSEHLDYLYSHGIDTVIDGPTLRRAADLAQASNADYFKVTGEEPRPTLDELALIGSSLLARLDKISRGSDEWPEYERLCADALEFLFCPPLGKPRLQFATRDRHNRRDFILRNFKSHEFWEYVRSTYEAHYIVVDSKNSADGVSKDDILEVANYLSPRGPGLFGIIMSRKGIRDRASITHAEQWAFNKKMIVIVDDADVRQMITMRMSDDDPAGLLADKIEDFRLGF
jgi:hypothetical protein